MINYYIAHLTNSAFKFEEENVVIYKEISSKLYQAGVYYWAKTVSDILFILPIVATNFLVVISLDLVHLRIGF